MAKRIKVTTRVTHIKLNAPLNAAIIGIRAELDAIVQVPPRLSSYPPCLHTPAAGRFEKWHVPAGLSRWLRARLHRVPEPSDPGDEWPHRSRVGDDEVKTIERWASELDRGEDEASPDSRPAQGAATVN